MTLDDIKQDAIFEADAAVFNVLRKELKEVGLKLLRNKVYPNSDYYEGRDVEHILIDNIPMYYKRISSNSIGSGIKFHLDMIKGEMPILYENLYKIFGKTSGPEFFDAEEIRNWFNGHLLHILNNKKLQSSVDIGVLEILKFKDFDK